MCIASVADSMCLLYLWKQIFIDRHDAILKTHKLFENIITNVVFYFIRKNPLNIYVVLVADFNYFIYLSKYEW